MPAISSRETIPNFPLNGNELAIYAVETFRRVCEQRDVLAVVAQPAVEQFKTALANDWFFKSQFTYANARFEIAFESHVIRNHETRVSFTLLSVFHNPNNPSHPKQEPFVRRPLNCPAPPLEGFSEEAEHVVDCFTISVKVENPNLVRVHHGMPIIIAEKIPPKHGELFPSFQNHEVRYSVEDYDPLPGPVVESKGEGFARLWDLPTSRLYVYSKASDTFSPSVSAESHETNLTPKTTPKPSPKPTEKTHAESAAEIHRETLERRKTAESAVLAATTIATGGPETLQDDSVGGGVPLPTTKSGIHASTRAVEPGGEVREQGKDRRRR